MAAAAPLHLIAPNGGERFRVGSSATIRWEGVAPSDTVTLEYSIDNGATWSLITDRATGLQYTWSPVPNTPSERCLMRASTKSSVGDSILWLKRTKPGFFLPDAVHFAEFSPDGSKVLGGGVEGDAYIWDSFTGALLQVITVETGTFPSRPGITRISSARYSPDGRFFVTISPIDARMGSMVRIFDAASGAKVREWAQDEGAGASTSGTCCYSPDGTRLLVMGLAGGKIYNVADGSLVATITGYSATSGTTTEIASMVDGDWRRDGSAIIGICNGGGTLLPDFILSDPAGGPPVNSYSYPGIQIVSSVRFSPDEKRFISTATDGNARIHDVASGAAIYTIHDYDRYPNWGEFSHNGLTFATAGQDNGSPNWKLRLYDATTGAFIRTVGAIGNGMRNLAYSPDDARILVSCIDGVRIFQSPQSTAGQADLSDSLWAIFTTNGAAVTVTAGRVTARQGENVVVPITIDDPAGALGAGATRIDVTLRYNATLLDPTGATPRGAIATGERTILLSLPITTDTILAGLGFRAALGNDSTTTLDLSGAAADIPTVTVTERDGLFRLSDLCREGGARLLNPEGHVALKVLAPGRDVEIETIEAGHTELVMIDMNGREVRRAIDGEPPPGRSTVHLDLTGIAAGRYFLILRTPTVSKSATMEVVR
jgi:WD40 repeat protein